MIYTKSKEDQQREDHDLKNNPLMRWLNNRDAFQFKVGDILIKKTFSSSWNPQTHNWTDSEWVTEVVNKNNPAPKKYIYAFENSLGIGYLKPLKANGTGGTEQLICVINLDPQYVKFELDPDYVDHTLIGDGDFNYNEEYQEKKKFRREAMEKNKKLLVKTSSDKSLIDWYNNLKVGDEFWYGATFDELVTQKYRIKAIKKDKKGSFSPLYNPVHLNQLVNKIDEKNWRTLECEVIEGEAYSLGSVNKLDITMFAWKKVSMTKPYPMKDLLCAPQK